MSDWILRRAGSTGLLVEVGHTDQVRWLADWLGNCGLELDDIVPGGRTVLVRVARGVDDVESALRNLTPAAHLDAEVGTTHVVPVRYTGEDLDAVCEHVGMSRADFVEAHTSGQHTVAYFGFTPGFPYIEGPAGQLAVPRLPTPRARVDRGAVAVANGFTIVYPGGTPGGWSIIGYTDMDPWWDIERDPPNLVDVGDRIAFQALT